MQFWQKLDIPINNLNHEMHLWHVAKVQNFQNPHGKKPIFRYRLRPGGGGGIIRARLGLSQRGNYSGGGLGIFGLQIYSTLFWIHRYVEFLHWWGYIFVCTAYIAYDTHKGLCRPVHTLCATGFIWVWNTVVCMIYLCNSPIARSLRMFNNRCFVCETQ